MRASAFILVVVGACGDVESHDEDAAVEIDAAAIDGAVDAAAQPCDRNGAWQVAPLTSLNTASEEQYAWLTDDMLTAYVCSNNAAGPGAYDIFRATRTSTSMPFGSLVVEQGVSTTGDERAPVLSHDRLTMYYSRLAASGTHYDMYVSTRNTTTAVFGAGQLMQNVNGGSDEHPTDVSADELTLYIESLRTANWEIYKSTRASTSDPFSAPQPETALNINTAGVADSNAVFSADSLTVYFTSNRTPTLGSYDIYVATRTTVNDGFGTPRRVDELSTASFEGPMWLSPDGCHLLFNSDRSGGGGGGTDLWLASKPAP